MSDQSKYDGQANHVLYYDKSNNRYALDFNDEIFLLKSQTKDDAEIEANNLARELETHLIDDLGNQIPWNPIPAKKTKMCPLRQTECFEHECGWWVDSLYTTEHHIADPMCALKVIALKNSDGKLPV